MGITNTGKLFSVDQIDCGGTFEVTLSLTAEPDITENPTDIVLILDRSGSMDGVPLESLKEAANTFIDIIDEATDGTQDGQIGSGSRIGIVSFATTASQDTQLITSVDDLKAAVDDLTANGSTNHEAAFTQALALFDPASDNAKVMIMFTDGETTAGGDANVVASAAKAQGVTIYSIGLEGDGGIDEQALEDWASDPSSAYVVIAPDAAELEQIFENLARNITRAGATDIVIVDTVNDCFQITDVAAPTRGTATLLNPVQVQWEIDELGVTQSEGAELTFTVEHVGPCSGLQAVNADLDYSDAEGNEVTFPTPELLVDCAVVVVPEPCPAAVDVVLDGCGDTVVFDAGLLELESQGRILQLDVTIPNVCPNKRVALAVLLYEVDDEGTEYARGQKTLVVPAHDLEGCRDVTVQCVKFVLPEELRVSDNGFCGERNFVARFIAHYIDTDFACCEAEV